MHKYEKIVNEIEQDFVDGKYQNVKKLPTEDELIKAFGVSRNTIRKAIEVLAAKGYIYQVQGSGIFIRETIRSGCIMVNNMKGLSRDFPDKKVKNIPLELKIIEADKEIAEKMKCKEGTELYYIKRLRMIDNKPFSIEVTYYNKEIIPYLNNDIASKSIYQYITKDLKLNIGFADKLIYAGVLSNDYAKLLDLPEGSPSMIVENVVFLANGLVFDVSQAIFNYKLAKFMTPATYK